MKRILLRNVFSEDGRMHDKKFKKVEEQIDLIEKNIPNLKNKVSDYGFRREAEKKSTEKIVTLLRHYAQSETGSLKFGLEEFAQVLNQLNQHLEVFLVQFEENVTDDLAEFKTRTKYLKSDLKAAVAAVDQEKIRQRQLQRLELLRDQEYERISAAEAELLKAKAESAKATTALDSHADIFEHKKLLGLRSALLNWTTLELRYHARALELFTEAYQAAAGIEIDADLQEFRNKMQTAEPAARLATVQKHMGSKMNRSNKEGTNPLRWPQPAGNRPSSRLSTNSSVGFIENLR